MQSESVAVPGRIVFVGLMGSGKTTVGHIVATELGRPLRDCDQDLRARVGMSAADAALRLGRNALHSVEADVLLDALSDPEPSVVTAAASTIEDPRCRAALDAVFVVWLTDSPENLAQRARTSSHRPLDADGAGQLRTQASRRDPLFATVADQRIDVAGRSPQELAVEVLGNAVRTVHEQ